jgi:hypothetical protein
MEVYVYLFVVFDEVVEITRVLFVIVSHEFVKLNYFVLVESFHTACMR